jgi:hypothetical protein
MIYNMLKYANSCIVFHLLFVTFLVYRQTTIFPFFWHFSHHINAEKKTLVYYEMSILHIFKVQNSSNLCQVIFPFFTTSIVIILSSVFSVFL